MIVNEISTKNLKLDRSNPVRSGAIVYTRVKGKTYFCFGVDTESGNLTDFGGGVTKYETVVQGGLRELEEESQGVFGPIKEKDICDTMSFYTYNMAIMFIPLDVNLNKTVKDFKNKLKNTGSAEVCNIVWLNIDDLLNSIEGNGKKLYVRVRRLLSHVIPTLKDLWIWKINKYNLIYLFL